MIIEERTPTFDEYISLRQSASWKLTEEIPTKNALENALYSVIATENEKVIGVGRVIGDGGLYYYVQDLIVDPDYQCRGYGRAMMSKLMNFIKQHASPGSIIGLMAAPGLEDFYREFGFESKPEYGTGMYIII